MGLPHLPAEVRLLIYSRLFIHHQPILFLLEPIESSESSGPRRLERCCLSSQALAVSHLLHDEGRRILYGENRFLVTPCFYRRTGDVGDDPLQASESIWQNIAQQIRKVMLAEGSCILRTICFNPFWSRALRNVRRVEIYEARTIDKAEIEYYKEAPVETIKASLREHLERESSMCLCYALFLFSSSASAAREVWWNVKFRGLGVEYGGIVREYPTLEDKVSRHWVFVDWCRLTRALAMFFPNLARLSTTTILLS